METLPTPRYPDIRITPPDTDDEDATLLLYGAAMQGLRDADVDDEELDAFTDEAMRADIDEAGIVTIVGRWVTIEGLEAADPDPVEADSDPE